MGRPSYKSMKRSVLVHADETRTVLEIAPTMRNIHHEGVRHFRSHCSFYQFEDGSYGGLYLSEHWAPRPVLR